MQPHASPGTGEVDRNGCDADRHHRVCSLAEQGRLTVDFIDSLHLPPRHRGPAWAEGEVNMASRLEDIFPSPKVVLAMEPEELAGFLLEYLNGVPKNEGALNFYAVTIGSGPLGGYAGTDFQQ